MVKKAKAVQLLDDLSKIPSAAWEIVMEAARSIFYRNNDFGVYAIEIGPKRVRGLKLDAITLVVYVERKNRCPANPVPLVYFEINNQSYSILPDVVATGNKPAPHNGWHPLFTGLHPGAQIVSKLPGKTSVGAVSLLIQTGGALQYLVTAGHLFPPGANGLSVWAAPQETQAPISIGEVLFNLLDENTQLKLDVAVVQLNDRGIHLAEQTVTSSYYPKFSSTVPFSNLSGIEGQAFLPIEHQYSVKTVTEQYLFTGYMESEVWGKYEVTNVLQADHPITNEGDSGTALFSSQYPTFAIGSCIGKLGQTTLVEYFDRSMRVIQQLLGKPIDLWHGDYYGGRL
jgi:hypothetical protein